VFEPNGAPPAFVDAVRRAARALDFRDRNVFSERERVAYGRIKEVGARQAVSEYHEAATAGGGTTPEATDDLALKPGEELFRRIPGEFLRQFVPFHGFLVTPQDHHLRVCFRSLRQAKGSGGTIYYSRHEPRLELGGRQYTLSFSGHAILRACERMAPEWPSYGALADVFAFFEQCLEFELCPLYPGAFGFTFFANCHPGCVSQRIAEGVLGGQFVAGRKYAYRVGYCPAVLEGRFIKATTLLFPGYAGTPEYAKIQSAGLPRDRRQGLLEATRDLNAARLLGSDGLPLLKWFHEQGVPQVRAGEVR
jgi:hypothetical protein